MYVYGGFGSNEDVKLKRDLNKAKKLLAEALGNLDFENNIQEVTDLKYRIEKFLEKGKKK